MSELEEGREKITRIMIEQAQAEHDALPSGGQLSQAARELPLRTVYVDEQTGRLVVGLAEESIEHRAKHTERLRSVVGDLDLDLRYVRLDRQACPAKDG